MGNNEKTLQLDFLLLFCKDNLAMTLTTLNFVHGTYCTLHIYFSKEKGTLNDMD